MPVSDVLVRIRATEYVSAAMSRVNAAVRDAVAKVRQFGDSLTSSTGQARASLSSLSDTGASVWSSLATGEATLQGALKQTSAATRDAQRAAMQRYSAERKEISSTTSAMSRYTSATRSVTNVLRQIASVGSSAFSRLASAAQSASSRMRGAASSAISSVRSGLSSLSASFDSLGGAIAGIAGGYSVSQMMGEAFTGAMQRELQQVWMESVVGKKKAQEYMNTIREVNIQSPAPDSFISQLLSGAVINQTNVSSKTLKELGTAASDYLMATAASGKPLMEAQYDLIDYIRTGNVEQLKRDSILKDYVDKLEKAKTVEERTKALNEALAAIHAKGISQQDTTLKKWEEFKGRVQAALITIGGYLLPVLNKILDFFSWLDKTTGGWSTKLGVAAGMIIAFIGSLPLIGAILSPIWDIGSAIKDALPSVSSLKSAFSSVASTAGTIKDKIASALPSVDDLKTRLSGLRSSLSEAARKAKDLMSALRGRISMPSLSGLKDALSSAASRAGTLKDKISGIRGVPGAVATSFKNLRDRIASATVSQEGLNKATLRGIWAQIKNAAATAAAAVKNFLLGAASKIAAAGQALLNAVMAMNPIFLVIMAIAILIGVILYLWNTNEGFRKAVMNVWNVLKGVAFFVWGMLVKAFQAFLDGLKKIWDFISPVLMPILQRLWDILSQIGSFIMSVLLGAWNAIRDAIKQVTDKIAPLIEGLKWLKDQWDKLTQSIWDAVNALQNFIIKSDEATGKGAAAPGWGVGVGPYKVGGGGGGSSIFGIGFGSPLEIRAPGGVPLVKFPDLDPRNLETMKRSLELAGSSKTGGNVVYIGKGAIQIDARDKTQEEAARIVAKGLEYFVAKESLKTG